jgi:hypothetical protein
MPAAFYLLKESRPSEAIILPTEFARNKCKGHFPAGINFIFELNSNNTEIMNYISSSKPRHDLRGADRRPHFDSSGLFLPAAGRYDYSPYNAQNEATGS